MQLDQKAEASADDLAQIADELKAIAKASVPYANNNSFALSQAVKQLIDVINAIGDANTFARLHFGLNPTLSHREDGHPTEQEEWHDYDPDC